MNVILINAGSDKVTTEYYPPLGIAYIASVLRKNRIQVSILDLSVERNIIISDAISDYKLVGIYFNTVNLSEALSIAKIAKSNKKIVVVGGPHASFAYFDCMRNTDIDFIVRGEGEIAFLNLINSLIDHTDLSCVKSLVYRQDGKVIVNELERLVENLDEIPLPARDLLPMGIYIEKNNDTSIIASRGCPYHCSFCAGTLMGRNRYRRRSVLNILSEIDSIICNYNFKRITFFDDIFTVDREFVFNLCNEIISKRYNLFFSCETRVDAVDLQMLNLMKKAKFDRIFFGIESGCQEILDNYNKGTKLVDIENAVYWCKKVGIKPMLSFIIGLPEDNENTIMRTIEFAKSLDVDNLWFQPFTPFPGTAAYEEARSSGIIGENYKTEYFNLRTVVMGTKYLTKKQVEHQYMNALFINYSKQCNDLCLNKV